MKRLLLLLLLLLYLPLFNVQARDWSTDKAPFTPLLQYDQTVRYYPDLHWQKAKTPEQLGWSSSKLQQVEEFTQGLATDALVIIENGIVVAAWGHPKERYKCHSIRKSLLSSLYGVYVGSGQIKLSKTLLEMGIDDNLGLSTVEKTATISDLLSARSGVYHPAAYETKTMRRKRPERGSHAPGSFWFYNNWDFNTLLTIFEKETKTTFFEEFDKRIATPLQMQQFRLQDAHLYWEKTKSMHPAYLFRMSALDLARFGLLYLRQGQWQNQQVIPGSWVSTSTAPHTLFKESKSPKRGYGYMWYTADEGYYAAGNGGNRVFVVPDQDIVIVHLVNTSVKGRRVKSKDIWKLLNKILEARK